MHPVDGVLLGLDHIHIAISQQASEFADALLQHQWEHIRLVIRDLGGPLHGVPRLGIDVHGGSGNHISHLRVNRYDYLLPLHLLGCPFVVSAPRAGSPVIPWQLRLCPCRQGQPHHIPLLPGSRVHQLIRQLPGHPLACRLLHDLLLGGGQEGGYRS